MGTMKKAFTLIELLVVIAIIAILAAILFPVFARAKDAAKKTNSLANVKQLGTAAMIYAADNDDVFQPMIEDNPVSGAADGIDYDASWMLKTQPYVKNIDMYFSPNSVNKRRPSLVAPRSSGGILFQYAMLPRWRFYAATDPGPGSLWRTGYATGGALMDGVCGYQFDPSAGFFYGDNNFCTSGTRTARVVPSLSNTQVARVSETALFFDARGWDYGFMCFNGYPAPADAMPPSLGPNLEGVNFEGRYTFEGTQNFSGVRYRIGSGCVVMTDSSARSLKTSQFYSTFATAAGTLAYRYQYSQE